jgi:hypothetical protein
MQHLESNLTTTYSPQESTIGKREPVLNGFTTIGYGQEKEAPISHLQRSKHATSLILNALLILASVMILLPYESNATDVIDQSKLKNYIERFNADDPEVYPTAVPNAEALEFLSANAPMFDCPDEDIERTYYFRWWTFRKHLRQTPSGWVITEFLPKVPWSGEYNTISCAAGHHIREARWLRDRTYVEDYIRFWLQKEGRNVYSSWLPDAVWAYCTTIGDYRLAKELLPDLIKHYKNWESRRLDEQTGLFWQNDSGDGMEGSISGLGYRPTINSYMFANANAIANIADLSGQKETAAEYREKAAAIKKLVQDRLWNQEHEFFEVRMAPEPTGLFGVRVNDDAELTKLAKPTSSSQQKPDCLTTGVVPQSSWEVEVPHIKFNNRGAEEWVQYDFPKPVELSSVQLFLVRTNMKIRLPESVRVFYRDGQTWKEVADAKGAIDKFDVWNSITFRPVITDGLKLQLRLLGFTRATLPLRNVRELLGYTPWMFNLPDPQYAVAWKQLTDSNGFAAPWGLTTAEQRHEEFELSYTRHECLWNGPVWPFATSQTLTALANLLNKQQQSFVDRRAYFETLTTYARSHQLKLPDGKVIPWIDENQNPINGDWIARTRLSQTLAAKPERVAKKGPEDRGQAYNHSTFCDLIIEGLIGLRSRSDDMVEVNPLVPVDEWDYFCLERVPYHGRMLTILWDKTGKRYGKGSGMRLLADGKEIAHSDTLTRVVGQLP